MSTYGIQLVDLAPSKYFDNFQAATYEEVNSIKQFWNDRGIKPYGMQSLFFGTTGLNIFESGQAQELSLFHLSSVCRIASLLGVKILVFGSPKNRDRGLLSDPEALSVAIPFFQQLGDIAGSHDLKVCLEPNPKVYNCNFMTNSEETAKVVRQINSPYIKMQCDIGAVITNGEDLTQVLHENHDIIEFVHLSEPRLQPLEKNPEKHNYISMCLKKYIPEIVVSIEILTPHNELDFSAVETSIKIATNFYR